MTGVWELVLLVAPSILKLVLWNIDTRTKVENNFREWVKKQQEKSKVYVEVKDSYDDQLTELNKPVEKPQPPGGTNGAG